MNSTASSVVEQSVQVQDLPKGFRYAGVTCGIKKSGKPDLALIASEKPCVAAGVYTQNVVRAASIDWNRTITPTSQLAGLVVNSGNANACTGQRGIDDNRAMAAQVATALGSQPEHVAVLSTGVIGQFLPMEKVLGGIDLAKDQLQASETGFFAAAEAIRTTDKFRKVEAASYGCQGAQIRIAAMAKGAGMIAPNMATMLAIVATDAPLDATDAQGILQRVADRSFNQISVDGHTSTNDALLLLANGQAEGITNVLKGEALNQFELELAGLCVGLAKKIPADGEGATHLIHLSVTGAANEVAARQVARSVAQSNLVKTAITGADPNWGRIVSAAGFSGVDMEPQQMSLKVNGFLLFQHGTPVPFDASQVSASMSANFETKIEISVGEGPGATEHWTSDLTVEYVRFNSEYTT